MLEEWKDEKTKPFNSKYDLTGCDVALPEEEGVDVCNALVSKRLGDFIKSQMIMEEFANAYHLLEASVAAGSLKSWFRDQLNVNQSQNEFISSCMVNYRASNSKDMARTNCGDQVERFSEVKEDVGRTSSFSKVKEDVDRTSSRDMVVENSGSKEVRVTVVKETMIKSVKKLTLLLKEEQPG